MKWLQMAAGANPSPFDCFLLTRSIKTLSLRCLQHGLSALTIAAHLEKHPLVEEVLYPGLLSHPQHERVKRALSLQVRKDLEKRNGWEPLGLPFGGVFSFRVKGPDEAGPSPLDPTMVARRAWADACTCLIRRQVHRRLQALHTGRVAWRCRIARQEPLADVDLAAVG
jgi:O-acetylhomoserine/O-acetylserine sulfhydrylase-like pyridoxal-dependent enzyme